MVSVPLSNWLMPPVKVKLLPKTNESAALSDDPAFRSASRVAPAAIENVSAPPPPSTVAMSFVVEESPENENVSPALDEPVSVSTPLMVSLFPPCVTDKVVAPTEADMALELLV